MAESVDARYHAVSQQVKSRMSEPLTIKAIADSITSLWGRSAAFLWCLATACFVALIALVGGAHWKIGETAALLASYGTYLGLAFLVLIVVASFRTFSERPQPVLSLIPKDQESFWCHAVQTDGRTFTQFHLKFQATNMSDGAIMLSQVMLSRPLVSRRRLLVRHLLIKHYKSNAYSFTNPIPAHSLTFASADIFIDHAIGRSGRPMRVTIRVQDHARRWHKLVFPHVPFPQAHKRAFPLA
jgi:hypothetical protein